MNRFEELSRTFALYKADLDISSDDAVDNAIRRFIVLLAIGHPASNTRAGQVAVLTAAMLIARSGHQVYVLCHDGPMVGHQPPFKGATIFEAVQSVRDQLITGSNIHFGTPDRIDIAFDFGTTSSIAPYPGGPTISVGWTAWSGEIARWPEQPPCEEFDWPMGAMAAAVLVAAEVAKLPMQMLASIFAVPDAVKEQFQGHRRARLRLANEETPKLPYLGEFTTISAGAVSNALFYALARLPEVHGKAVAFDEDISEPSNLNRNMLLLRAFVEAKIPKVAVLEHWVHGLKVLPKPRHFLESDLDDLSGRVVVGVDHVPTRWLLARGRYDWMGVGATSHFNVLSSVHFPYSGCAACLHPHDENGPPTTPTIAFVSFLAGLQLAADLIVNIVGTGASLVSHQRFIAAMALGGDAPIMKSGVAPRLDCPADCCASRSGRAD